jgi:hypothetical protein
MILELISGRPQAFQKLSTMASRHPKNELWFKLLYPMGNGYFIIPERLAAASFDNFQLI